MSFYRTVLFLLPRSNYGALHIFAEELQKSFRKQGTVCYNIDGTHYQNISDLTYALSEKLCCNPELIISLNGALLNFIESVETAKKELTADITILAYYVDHPLWHHTRLCLNLENYHAAFVDDSFTKYARQYYPNIITHDTVRQAGILSPVSDTPFMERKNEVCFLGSYTDQEELHDQIDASPDREILSFMIDYGMKNPRKTVEEILSETVRLADTELSKEEFAETLAASRLLEYSLRSYFRQKMVRTLIENNIPVSVYGDGWEQLQSTGREYLHPHPSIPYRQMAEVMSNYRFALNVLPWAKYGFHDRPATAMLNGCLCITDTSHYIESEGLPGKKLLTWTLSREEEILPKIRYYMAHPQDAQAIAEAGKAYALENHTWKNRAEQIIAILS